MLDWSGCDWGDDVFCLWFGWGYVSIYGDGWDWFIGCVGFDGGVFDCVGCDVGWLVEKWWEG